MTRPVLRIGQEFTHPSTGHVHRVTDIGSRTFLTVDATLNPAASGPPYDVIEHVWDEYDQEVLRDVDGISWG